VGTITALPLSRADRLAARCRAEQRAFRLVLETLKASAAGRAGGPNDLFLRLYGFYRVRMRTLRRIAGALAPETSAAEELAELMRARDGVADALDDGDGATPWSEPDGG